MKFSSLFHGKDAKMQQKQTNRKDPKGEQPSDNDGFFKSFLLSVLGFFTMIIIIPVLLAMALFNLFKKKETNKQNTVVNEFHQKSNDTFVCKKCRRELAIKYLHADNTCADCFIPTNRSSSPAASNGISYGSECRGQKCSQCLRPIDGHIWKSDNKTYCKKCYDRRMASIQQTERQPSSRDKDAHIVTNTQEGLLNETVIYSQPVTWHRGGVEPTDFIIRQFTDRVEIFWGVAWRGGVSHADGAGGTEILEADYFQKYTIQDFIAFLQEKPATKGFVEWLNLESDEQLLALFKKKAERSQKIDSPFLGEEYKLNLPKTLFRWSDNSSDRPGDNVYQHWEDVILDKDGRLIIEENSITYSAHSIGHNTGRDTTTKPLSFDQLPKMIALAEDKNAQKYLGMNEQNWPKYVRVRKTNEELASELETVVTLDLDYSNWVELRLHKTTGRAYTVKGENVQHGGALIPSITSIKRAFLSEASSMVAKEYDYSKAFKLLYPKWEDYLCRKVLAISDGRYRIGWFVVVDGVEMPREAILFGETVFQVPIQFLTEDQHKKYAAYHTQTGPYEHYFDLPAECCEKVIRKLVPLASEKTN